MSTENAEVEEAEAVVSRHGSVNTFTENDVINGTRTTSSGHEAMDMFTENAEVDEAETAGSRLGSVHTFTENAVVDETPTTSSRHDSIDTPENAEVEEAQIPGTGLGSVSRSTENAGVDETQTSSGLVYDVRPWRRKRLDMESGTVGGASGGENRFAEKDTDGD
ncbi:hypothetical protein PR202_gb02978 [Eleusine coracana subsp. coracana]|uniref:Uncharacterized protein n=1 Tax=Eleusine coracana subsp. coracana TaxID=191504 RepID=A0AAV5E0M2_ELECO|nr:hypothetical protein PR202_gb02978 [Eleusine coracana subsp. coracana]